MITITYKYGEHEESVTLSKSEIYFLDDSIDNSVVSVIENNRMLHNEKAKEYILTLNNRVKSLKTA